MPRIQSVIDTFTCRELLYILYGYFKIGHAPKQFIRELEAKVVQTLRQVESVEPEEVQLMCQVFCRSRLGSRDLHKLLETVILTRLDDIKQKPKMLHSIGFELESSGLCSIDTLKILKKQML